MSAALTWCAECRKFTPLHLLIHTIDNHAPRLGDRRNGAHSWRTATLTDRAAVDVRTAA